MGGITIALQPLRGLIDEWFGSESRGREARARFHAFGVEVRRAERQRDREHTALRQAAADGDLPAVQLHQLLHQREPDSTAFVAAPACAVDSMKALEQVW